MKNLISLILSILLISTFASGETVKLEKIIDLKGKKKKNIVEVLFGKKPDLLIKPVSIVEIDKGLYCVTDQSNGRIVIINEKGDRKKNISTFNGKNFISPVSCARGNSGGFYVSDSYYRSVIEFGKDLKYKRILISDQNRRITGIYFYLGKLFCTDTQNHQVVIYDLEGKEILHFGDRGSEIGKFNYPTHIVVDTDSIYITDALNFRVQIFDHSGEFVATFGRNGRSGGEFSKPKGIAVDSEKRIYVTDVMFDNIQIFDSSGQFLHYFGGPGSGDLNFWMPSGILLDKAGRIFVLDTYNSRIQIFKVIQETE